MARKKGARHNKKQMVTNSRSEYSGGRRSNDFGFRLSGGYHFADQKRDVWGVAGYPDKVNFDMHWNMQARFGIASAGIYRIVDKCWANPPTITDGEPDENRTKTPFEVDLDILIEKYSLFSRLKGVDWRQRVGRYGGILPIVREPIKIDPNMPMPKLMGINALIKLVPVHESEIDVTDIGLNDDLTSEEFGNPIHYNFRQQVNGDRNPVTNNQFIIHPTRVFVTAEGADDGSIFGIPANEAGFNDLLDMEKVRAAGAEGLFKNAKQRVVYNVDDAQVAGVLTSDQEKRDQWNEANDDFHSGFDASQMLYGMNAETLQSTLADPTAPFTIALNSYCAHLNIPATILIGQQTGRLASDEDQTEWALAAQSRCENYLTPQVIKAFLAYMVDRGLMSPPTNEVIVTWPDFLEPTKTEKVALAKSMEETNELRYKSGRAEPIYSDEEVREAAGCEDIESKTEEFIVADEPKEIPVNDNNES